MITTRISDDGRTTLVDIHSTYIYLLGAVLSALSVLSKIDRSVFSCFFRDCRSLSPASSAPQRLATARRFWRGAGELEQKSNTRKLPSSCPPSAKVSEFVWSSRSCCPPRAGPRVALWTVTVLRTQPRDP